MIKIILYIIILAALHGKLEIQIEGDAGWAKNLPCKKFNNKFLDLILGKGITAYHIWMLILFLFIFHMPFLFIEWSIKQELFTLGLFCFYFIIEDLFWFIEHEKYGIKKFRKNCIDWHRRFFCGLPYSYIGGIILGIVLLLLGWCCP
jgi:hypothetical protein